MTGKPVGANVGLYWDSPRHIEPGDYLRTATGRTYLVDTARRQTRGRHVGRWHLRCVVVNPSDIAPDARVYPVFWYRRRGAA